MTVLTAPLNLARIPLNRYCREVRADLRDRGSLHRRVQSLFPDQLGPHPRAAAGVLFRLERTESCATLLVQSAIPVNRNALPTGYTSADVEYRDLAPLLDWAQAGRTVQYRIDAQPQRSVREPHRPGVERPRGKPVSLIGQDAVDWWHRQALLAGLQPHTILDLRQPIATVLRETAQSGSFRITRFEGTATITDPDALRTALRKGIGQGRSYGLGLLSIAPHRP
ncbi:type I-E CRISPR-associated protein Cas6/Cse3/CasE [Kitasatospora sp. NRRL B-11411]|uniref:type I-E CRISPR-associated protein Cas6/Cse3/CasE n=1 Tax=Kitasatospora sp. NRRL B-11411 TaxID=1463822 RepID=UPI00068E7FAE|nr:type I-E CRISPR-associated protein Cas6/Cse3/CasE [Kitasatospora sp. NRRL B-11411]